VFSTRSLTQLDLHFLDFSTIFYGLSKSQQKSFTIEDMVLHRDPWVFSKAHKYALGSQKSLWKERGESNWVPSHGEATARRNSGSSGGGSSRVGARGGVRAHLGLDFDRSWGGQGAGEWAQ
jgi:hypothetical protein